MMAHIRNVLTNFPHYLRALSLEFNLTSFNLKESLLSALLAESHINIHTWPENGNMICDVFTCGDHTNPRSGVR